MNIIFLDVDGILNTSSDRQINRNMVKRLSRLVKVSNSRVILHSGWRFWFTDDMQPFNDMAKNLQEELWKEGITLSGKTPDLADEDIKKTQSFSKVKASEILLWLDRQSDVDGWAVLEDLDLKNETIKKHQIMPDPDTGLTDEDIDKAITLITGSAYCQSRPGIQSSHHVSGYIRLPRSG